MKKNSVLGGAVTLTVFMLAAKLIGALYKIPLSRVLGEQGLGLYLTVFPPFSLALALCSGGVTAAMSITVSAISRENAAQSKRLALYCLALFCSLAVIPTVIMTVFASSIATLQGAPTARYGYPVIALALLPSVGVAVLRGYEQGRRCFFPSAISQLTEQAIKLVIGLALSAVIAKNNPSLAFIGAIVGVTVAEAVTLTYMLLRLKAEKCSDSAVSLTIKPLIGKTVRNAFPIMLGSLILPTVQLIDSLVIVNILRSLGDDLAVAKYGMLTGSVASVMSVASVIFSAVTSAVLPKISARDSRSERGEISSQALTLLVGLGLLLLSGIAVFSENAAAVMLGSSNDYALTLTSRLLRLSALALPYQALTAYGSCILQGIGKGYLASLSLLVGGAVKISVCPILTRLIGIEGAALSGVIFYAVAALVIIPICRIKNPSVSPRTTPKLALATAAFTVAALTVKAILPFDGAIISAFIPGAIALAVYALCLFALGVAPWPKLKMIFKRNNT